MYGNPNSSHTTKAKKGKKAPKAARKAAKKTYEKVKKTSKLGSGKRFAALSGSLKKEGYSKKSAGAIAASIGRKKYGAKKMASMSAKGRKK